MIHETVKAIAKAIHSLYPDSKIYDSPPQQGLENRSFLIKCTSPSLGKVRGHMYEYDNDFDIAYFPDDQKEPERECMEVAEDLQMVLECIEIAGKKTWIKEAADISIVDAVLHFKATYRDEYLRQDPSDEKIATMSGSVKVKG